MQQHLRQINFTATYNPYPYELGKNCTHTLK